MIRLEWSQDRRTCGRKQTIGAAGRLQVQYAVQKETNQIAVRNGTGKTPLSTPENDLIHFEDMSPGTRFPLGPKHVVADEIMAFAMEYDPQPMHLDEAAGSTSILGGLAASGWHSCAMMMRMMTDSYLLRTAAEGAPGLDYVKWLRPVFAGDVLTGETRVLEGRKSRSRPGIGIVSLRHELRNQRGNTVLVSENPVMLRLRPAREV